MPIASLDRQTIRERVGYNLGTMVLSTASAIGGAGKTTLVDTIGLGRGGDDEYTGWHLQMISGTATNIGLKRWVSDFAASTGTLTFAALTDQVAAADGYELWSPPYDIDHVNALISQAEDIAKRVAFIDKESHGVFTQADKYLYGIPSGFVGIHTLEYNYHTGEEITLENCDNVWDESVDTDVTATADSTINQEGSACLKLVVAAGCAAHDILATQVIDADLTGCSEVEIWIYSTVALNAGDIHLLLDDTALCASPVETLDIPATAANTWTRHVISLANPQSDGALVSIGFEMEVDKGAFTLYADYITAVRGSSRDYKLLTPEHWDIVRGSTDYLTLTALGLDTISANRLLRLTGYQALTSMSADGSTAEIDPAAIINWVTATLQLSSEQSIAYQVRARIQMDIDTILKRAVSTSLAPGTRFF